jgi:hypothetical protein
MKTCRNTIFAFCTIGVAVTGPTLGADNPFDGTYSGTRKLTKGSYESCQKMEEMSITVQNGRFTFTDSDSQAVRSVIQIASNGSFSDMHAGGGGSWYVTGQITGDVLEAEANSSACFHHWSLKKK